MTFKEHGEVLEGLFISQCILFLFYVPFLGCLMNCGYNFSCSQNALKKKELEMVMEAKPVTPA